MGFPKVKWGQSVGAGFASSISAGRLGAPALRPMGPATRAGQGSFFGVWKEKIVQEHHNREVRKRSHLFRFLYQKEGLQYPDCDMREIVSMQ